MKIYLATAYSSPSGRIEEFRFRRINELAAHILAEGHIVFSPISHSHPIAMAGNLPKTFGFWEEQARAFIVWADELWVYRGDGWLESKGVEREMLMARNTGKPVEYIDWRGNGVPRLPKG